MTLITAAASFSCFLSLASLAEAKTAVGISTEEKNDHEEKGKVTLCEVRGGKRIGLVPDYERDEFIVPKTMWQVWRLWAEGSREKTKVSVGDLWDECKDLVMRLMLPDGFPESVTSDYLEYSLWRGFQGVAAQVSGVLATQVCYFSSLLFVVKAIEYIFLLVLSLCFLHFCCVLNVLVAHFVFCIIIAV